MSGMFFNSDFHQREQEGKMQQSPSSCAGSMKTSPSYLEWDVQFNYPDATTDHAKQENEVCSESQDSELNTLLEVIDEHEKNDVSSMVSATPIAPHAFRMGHSSVTQPINIQGQSWVSATPDNKRKNLNISSIDMTPPENKFSVVVPPASDTRKYNQFGVSPADSSIANSPAGGFMFQNYPQESNSFAVQSPKSALGDVHSNARTPDSIKQYADPWSVVHQTSEDAMSPAYMINSPASWQQPQHLAQVNPRDSCDDVFVSEEDQQSEVSPCSFNDISSPSSVGSERPSSVMTAEQRLDARRKRNNLACQKSRKRRKKRRDEKEVSALLLAEANNALKLRIKQLERDVAQAHEDVHRKISQS